VWPFGFVKEAAVSVGNVSTLNNYRYLFAPLPHFLGENITISKYFMGHAIVTVFGAFSAGMVLTLLLFVFVAVSSVYNAFVSLANVMHSRSQNIRELIEKDFTTNWSDETRFHQACVKHCKEYVRNYRKLIE